MHPRDPLPPFSPQPPTYSFTPNTELAADLYEAYRCEWAITPLFVQPDLTSAWAELPVEERHFWKGVIERFERTLAESAAATLR